MNFFKRRDSNIDNELSLAQKCAKGDRTAQRYLYEKYKTKMFGICLRYCSDHMMAEDVLQESFIKIFYNINKFEGKGSLEGWVRRIVVGTAVDAYRKLKKTILYVETPPENFSHNADILSQIETDELLAYLQRLPTGYRLVFNLYVVEGYSHAEIANALNITESTSRSQLARARQMLIQMIEPRSKNQSETQTIK